MDRFKLQEGEKFAFVVVKNCSSTVEGSVVLSDGTVALDRFPAELDGQWKKWIGEVRAFHLQQGNLIIVRSLHSLRPGILDEENHLLQQQLTEFFMLLRLLGPIDHEGAEIVQGYMYEGEVHIRQMVELDHLYPTLGSVVDPVTAEKMEETAKKRQVRQEILSVPDEYGRLKRGFRGLGYGLMQYHGEDRLHQFVRAIEALTIPADRTNEETVCRTSFGPDERR